MLNIHNLTFYDTMSHAVLDYLWTQIDGNLESNNFISIYEDYIKMRLEEAQQNIKINEVIILE